MGIKTRESINIEFDKEKKVFLIFRKNEIGKVYLGEIKAKGYYFTQYGYGPCKLLANEMREIFEFMKTLD